MFKSKIPVPHGVEIERFFDRRTIENGDSTVSFFQPSPDGKSTNNNYTNNPFPESKFHVILALSLDPLTKIIPQTADIDPAYVINNLNDGTLILSSNQGRTKDVVNPVKDYLNFNNTQIATGVTGADSHDLIATIGSTGVRQPDNLFFLGRQESFTLQLEFNSGVWPTVAHWTAAGVGRFGILAEMYVAKMTASELKEYAASMGATLRLDA